MDMPILSSKKGAIKLSIIKQTHQKAIKQKTTESTIKKNYSAFLKQSTQVLLNITNIFDGVFTGTQISITKEVEAETPKPRKMRVNSSNLLRFSNISMVSNCYTST